MCGSVSVRKASERLMRSNVREAMDHDTISRVLFVTRHTCTRRVAQTGKSGHRDRDVPGAWLTFYRGVGGAGGDPGFLTPVVS